MKTTKIKSSQKHKQKENIKLPQQIHVQKIVIIFLIIIITMGCIYIIKLSKKDQTKLEPKKPLFISYPFSSTNPRHDLIKQLKTWFSKEKATTTNPPDWPGEGGKAVVVPQNMKKLAEKRFKENQFNIVASEMIALDRSIPDGRDKEFVSVIR